MYAEKAVDLVKDAQRHKDSLNAYNTDLVEEVGKEICLLIEENHDDSQALLNGDLPATIIPTIKMRHMFVERNLRCLIAYHYNRLQCLRNMRWEFGSILPADIKTNLSASESAWFTKYSNILSKYMRNINDDGGINLGNNLKPPKSLYMEVRCLADYGKHQLNDGSIILLKKNTRYYLLRDDCEEFVRLGIFQHVAN